MQAQQDDTIIRALLWAVGLSDDSEFEEPVDSNHYADLLRAHRITGRFNTRRKLTATELSPSLAARIEDDSRVVARAISHERNRLHLLDKLFDGYSGRKPIVVKGNSVAYALGNEEIVRATEDTDLLVATADGEAAWLRERGFTQRVDHMPHEMPPLVMDENTHVDLHAYFPAWQTPDDAPRSRLKAPHRAAHWVTSSRLNYEVLREDAAAHPVASRGGLLVPSIEANALILALHMFHDAVELPPNAQRPRVRLVELAELHDLLESDAFNYAKLHDLVHASGARQAWDGAQELLGQVFEAQHVDARAPVSIAAIQQVAWGLLWKADANLADVLLWPNDGVQRLTQLLGAEAIRLDASQDWRSTHRDLPGEQVKRALISGGEDGDFGLRFRVERSREDVQIIVETLDGPGPFLEEFAIRTPGGSIYAGWEISRGSFRLNSGDLQVSASWEELSRGWRCTLNLPDQSLSALFAGGDTQDAFLECVSFREPVGDDWTRFYRGGVASTAVMLELAFDQSRLGQSANMFAASS